MEVGMEGAGAVGGAWEGEGWAGGRGGRNNGPLWGKRKKPKCQNGRLLNLSKCTHNLPVKMTIAIARDRDRSRSSF